MNNNKVRVQIIGNYLEPLERPLMNNGILFESVIPSCSPLAMEGDIIEDNLKYCNGINQQPALLNLRKNLSQMLSRDPENFCQNYNSQPHGKEVRYRNMSEYLILMNTSMGYSLFEKNTVVYSDLYPQNQFTTDIKADKSYRALHFPFHKSFNWKYYYDKFIDAVLREYDSEHIILIRTNSAQWYMDKREIKTFDKRSSQYRNMVEQMDEYFIARTKCLCINEQYAHIPDKNMVCVFPFALSNGFAYKQYERAILDIIKNHNTSPYKTSVIKGASFEQLLYKKLSSGVIELSSDCLRLIREESLSIDDVIFRAEKVLDKLFTAVSVLRRFLDADNGYTLSDYVIELLADKNSLDEKINFELVETYTKYMKLNINDIIAVYMMYSRSSKKELFKNIIANIIDNPDCLPITFANRFRQSNIDFLSNYPYIQDDLKCRDESNEVYIRLNTGCYIVVDKTEKTMSMANIDIKDAAAHMPIIDNGYICPVECADALCGNMAFYIEKARKGDGNAPVKIQFDSIEKFRKYLSIIDYPDLLDTEPFVLCLVGSDYSVADYSPRTDLSFLFKKGTMICFLASGFTNQICYYLVAKRAQELKGGEVYFDDTLTVKMPAFNGTEDLKRIAKEDISKRLFTNIFNKRLISVLTGSERAPDVLYKYGCKHIVAASAYQHNLKDIHLCHRFLYTINASASINEFFLYNFDLTYYIALIRPEHILRRTDFQILKYISFPEYDTEKNIQLAKQMNSCDAVAIHIRRGDYITLGIVDDLDFYKESLEKIKNISDYGNKKFFIFSDDIPWCKSHLDEIGFGAFPDADITFVDHNKGADSYRDMQLMTEAKIHISGSSGFSRIVPLLSRKNEIYMNYDWWTMELIKSTGKINKYDIGRYSKQYATAWGQVISSSSTKITPLPQPSTQKTDESKLQKVAGGIIPGREITEFLNFWFDKANMVRNDRILLIGDSISRAYRGPLAALTGRPVDFFATTTSIDEDMFWKTLELFFGFEEYRQQKAHIQIGLHSIDGFMSAKRNFSLEEYERNYDKLVKTVKKYIPDLTIATTTKVVQVGNLTAIDQHNTEEVIKRNEIAMRIAKKHGLKTNDLFTSMYNSLHRDLVHFTTESIQEMAKHVAKAMGLI